MKCQYPMCSKDVPSIDWKFCPYHPPYQFVIVQDKTGRYYIFGTNPKMNKEVEFDRFRNCDVLCYPVGDKTGYENNVTIIETSLPIGCDEALALFRSGTYTSRTAGKPVTYHTLTPHLSTECLETIRGNSIKGEQT